MKQVVDFFTGQRRYLVINSFSQVLGLTSAVAMALAYSTDEIGVYAILWAKLMIYGTFSCLRYELAFFSIRNRVKKNIHFTSCLFLILITSLAFLGVDYILTGHVSIILFAGCLIVGLRVLFLAYINSLGENSKIAWMGFIDNLFFVVLLLSLNELVYARLISLLILLIVSGGVFLKVRLSIQLTEGFSYLRIFKNFPRYNMVSNGVIAIQREGMPFILAQFMPIGVIGALSVFDRIFKVPVRLASDMVKTVYLSKLSLNSFSKTIDQQLKQIIQYMALALAGVAIIGYFGVDLIFSNEFVDYKWLIFLLLLMNVVRLSFVIRSSLFVMKNNQVFYFRWAMITLGLLGVMLGLMYAVDDQYSIFIYTGQVVLSYFIGNLFIKASSK